MYLVGLCIYIYIYISRHFISSRILLSAGTLFVPRISFYVKILGVFKTKFRGHSVAQFVAELGHKPQGRGFDSLWQIFFSPTWFFRPHCGPQSRLSLNKKEYREYFLGGKDGRRVRMTTLPLLCADCIEICESETSETLRAYSGLYRGSFYRLLPETNFRWKFDELPGTLEIEAVFITSGLHAVRLSYSFIAEH